MPTTSRRVPVSRRRTAIILRAAIALCLWACAPAFGETEACPNAQIRAEQPYSQRLPDCRAYELVSPLDTNGQDATLAEPALPAHAALTGDAIAYSARGVFGEPSGNNLENVYVSRRGQATWITEAVSPLRDPQDTEPAFSSEGDVFTPELTKAIIDTSAPLVEGAPGGKAEAEFGLYVAGFGDGSYQFVAPGIFPFGASTDLSRVMLERSEWINGTTVPVTVTNEGEAMDGTPGAPAPNSTYISFKDFWHAVSSDGFRVSFTTPSNIEMPGALARIFVRVNVGQPQSPIVQPEATGTGTLTSGSRVVSTLVTDGSGRFVVGQKITGDGIAAGTTVTAVGAGSLTLSGPAVSSGVGVALDGGGGCTVAADACTIDVSASQRLKANPAGQRSARYWGASADGSRVFFTSAAELTEDAYTGPSGNAPNLYEYRLPAEAGQRGRLTDLSVTEAGDGAAVLGVAQISEDGSYVYFVAEGDLAAGATAGKPNLYVSHEGVVRFIATLTAGDLGDWDEGELSPQTEAGPEVNTTVVNPSGTKLAFLSTASLTGYDNQQAQPGECTGGECREVFLYDSETSQLVCASCNPAGSRPVGSASFNRVLTKANNEYRPRNLLDDGVLFFETPDALVASATSGHENVYEFENGRPFPVSAVTGGFESFFMDASPSGGDVFIGTADKLLDGQETEDNVAVYDARVDGGLPEPATVAQCVTPDACLPPETRQASGSTSGSATFTGPGNAPTPLAVPVVKEKTAAQIRAANLARALKACRRNKLKKRRLACERAARKRYAPHAGSGARRAGGEPSHGIANSNRGPGR